jgi:hypothetical protein
VWPEKQQLVYRSSSSMVQVVKTRSFFPAAAEFFNPDSKSQGAATEGSEQQQTSQQQQPLAVNKGENDNSGGLQQPYTRVIEHLTIICPWLLQRTVKHAAKAAHTAHMESYHKLFPAGECNQQDDCSS